MEEVFDISVTSCFGYCCMRPRAVHKQDTGQTWSTEDDI